jgi:hypothetical protein
MLYFFHYRDAARYFADDEGTELFDLAAAQSEGRLSARELLGSERAESDPEFLPGAYEIADAAGLVLAVVQFDERTPQAIVR